MICYSRISIYLSLQIGLLPSTVPVDRPTTTTTPIDKDKIAGLKHGWLLESQLLMNERVLWAEEVCNSLIPIPIVIAIATVSR